MPPLPWQHPLAFRPISLQFASMITYDGVACELDERASGIQLILPLPDAKDPRPRVMMHLRFTMPDSVPERGDFIGQDAMLLRCPAQPVDMKHWEELSEFRHSPRHSRRAAMFDMILLHPEPVAGKDTDMLNATPYYEYSLRHTGGFMFFLELESAVLPLTAASQQLFGWGDNPPTPEELQEMCEPLHIMEELPLWRILVQAPADLPDRTAWAQAQAQQRLGLHQLSEHPHGPFHALQFPRSGHVLDVPSVPLITPWVEDGEP